VRVAIVNFPSNSYIIAERTANFHGGQPTCRHDSERFLTHGGGRYRYVDLCWRQRIYRYLLKQVSRTIASKANRA